MFRLFKNRNKTLDDILEQSEQMEKYFAMSIDVDAMVNKFKDDIIGEFDSATTQRIADTYGEYYRQGIEDTLKAIRGTKKKDESQ